MRYVAAGDLRLHDLFRLKGCRWCLEVRAVEHGVPALDNPADRVTRVEIQTGTCAIDFEPRTRLLLVKRAQPQPEESQRG